MEKRKVMDSKVTKIARGLNRLVRQCHFNNVYYSPDGIPMPKIYLREFKVNELLELLRREEVNLVKKGKFLEMEIKEEDNIIMIKEKLRVRSKFIPPNSPLLALSIRLLIHEEFTEAEINYVGKEKIIFHLTNDHSASDKLTMVKS
ncbi:hypothetical protein CM19_01595 [Candidatus Acidianus copahuensis]|uniref:Uncharacterized protein n=1 Tax=Candidatus Acidianus copahuensis TaxID=1160895 RepID=A0A031LUE3_9CREN|nr:hypothetical protein [Candidatus Acidianus copahuensis]EZQ11446.1 hypothetical protein CM19_01595 [Candidatus Acidianus copahuensis]